MNPAKSFRYRILLSSFFPPTLLYASNRTGLITTRIFSRRQRQWNEIVEPILAGPSRVTFSVAKFRGRRGDEKESARAARTPQRTAQETSLLESRRRYKSRLGFRPSPERYVNISAKRVYTALRRILFEARSRKIAFPLAVVARIPARHAAPMRACMESAKCGGVVCVRARTLGHGHAPVCTFTVVHGGTAK